MSKFTSFLRLSKAFLISTSLSIGKVFHRVTLGILLRVVDDAGAIGGGGVLIGDVVVLDRNVMVIGALFDDAVL